MSQLITIRFEQLRFFAYHGLYAGEKKAGNEFEMNLAVSFSAAEGIISHIHDTLNYATIYDMIKKEMQQPRELLETFLTELAELLKTQFPQIKHLQMSLYKLTVPIENFSGRVGVELERTFES
ncbi:MAG: dihydroneopterin aldolase [Niabella sp.]|nr:dihydroneopterin aldolase [Niabella sp.]